MEPNTPDADSAEKQKAIEEFTKRMLSAGNFVIIKKEEKDEEKDKEEHEKNDQQDWDNCFFNLVI